MDQAIKTPSKTAKQRAAAHHQIMLALLWLYRNNSKAGTNETELKIIRYEIERQRTMISNAEYKYKQRLLPAYSVRYKNPGEPEQFLEVL